MDSNTEIKFKVTIRINEKWASQQTQEEIEEYLMTRLNSSLGFRGEIKKIKVIKK